MSSTIKDLPVGIKIMRYATRNFLCNWSREIFYRALILILTFIAYLSYHLTRKPISVVKNVLHPNCTNIQMQAGVGLPVNCSGWAPFNKDNAGSLFGTLDSSFLFAYAFAMFVSGMVAERVNLRYFLSLGMILSGSFCYLFGLAKSLNIHSLAYFIVVQIFMGIFQTSGWPSVVTIIGHWFGKEKRGLIFGIWNSHTSIGNIMGTFIAGYYVESNWGYSFIVPGFLMAAFGFIMFLFIVVHPEDVGCMPPVTINRSNGNSITYSSVPQESSSENEDDTSIFSESSVPKRRVKKNNLTEKSPFIANAPEKAIKFVDALKIPGVIEFSLSLFFSKFVSYTFLYWLPYYISSSTNFGASLSAKLSILLDVGGIVGAIVAGVIADTTNMSATVCITMLSLAVPVLYVYQAYGNASESINILLLLILGAFVNGPCALITTTVSAELGTHESLLGSSKALATVTAIIDGTGSIGAAVGPLLTGLVSPMGWDKVFYLLMISEIIALTALIRLMVKELSQLGNIRHRLRIFS